MRASILLLLSLSLFLSLSSAENDLAPFLFGFSGNWESTGTMFIPSWASDGTCTVGTTAYHYAWFNYTFNGDGVRRFSSFENFDYVFVYENGFNPAAPCQGMGWLVEDDRSGVEYYTDSYTWYKGGVSYTFVLADSSTSDSFTGKITEGMQGATSNATGMTRNPIYIGSSGCVLEDQGSDKPYYARMPFTVNTTRTYDVMAYFAHSSVPGNQYPSYTYLAVYMGSPNSSLEMDGCGAVGDGVKLVAATYNSYQYTEIIGLNLVAGMTYTAIVSTYNNDFWGPFGLEVAISRRFNFTYPTTTTGTTVGGFTEPPRDNDHYGVPGFNCAQNDDGYNNRPYAVFTFDVPSNYNFTMYADQPSGDLEFFFYTGENINPPTACLTTGRYLDYWDSRSDQTYGPYSANDFTLVATPYSSSSAADGFYMEVYVIYGAPITSGGPVVTTTTTGSTTGSTTGTVLTTTTGMVVTTTTGGKPVTTTTTTGTRPTVAPTTTSSASAGARFANAVLFVAAVFVLLM